MRRRFAPTPTFTNLNERGDDEEDGEDDLDRVDDYYHEHGDNFNKRLTIIYLKILKGGSREPDGSVIVHSSYESIRYLRPLNSEIPISSHLLFFIHFRSFIKHNTELYPFFFAHQMKVGKPGLERKTTLGPNSQPRPKRSQNTVDHII